MKNVVNIILTVLFILFALVQFNDPDPYLWILIYGSIALVSGLAIKNIYNKTILMAMMVACILGSIYYFPGLIELVGDHKVSDLTKTMKAEQPFIEESRESLGLLIGFLALLYHYFKAKKHPKEGV